MPDHPTLVLLHAFPLSSVIYEAVAEELSQAAELITPDFAGFGVAPLSREEPSLDLLADGVVGLLDARGIETAVVGGTSMGGYVALNLARRYPQRLVGLVLANTRAVADTDEARENRIRIAESVVDVGPQVALRDMDGKLLGVTTQQARPDLVDRVHAMVAAADPVAVAWAQVAMAARPGSLEVLRSFERPVLVVTGAEDTLMPVSDSEAMAAAAPNSRLEVLPSAGHLACLEQPEAWSAAVRGWLATFG